MVQLVGAVRGPEAGQVTVEEVALDGPGRVRRCRRWSRLPSRGRTVMNGPNIGDRGAGGEVGWLSDDRAAASIFAGHFPVGFDHQDDGFAKVRPSFFEGSALGVGTGKFLDEGDVALRNSPEHRRAVQVHQLTSWRSGLPTRRLRAGWKSGLSKHSLERRSAISRHVSPGGVANHFVVERSSSSTA